MPYKFNPFTGNFDEVNGDSSEEFGIKNYFVDPLFNENVDATRSYRELSFFNDGSGVFTDGGGLGYIVAFTGHGITQNQRVFYYHDGSPLDGSGNVIGVECYAQVLGPDIFGLSPVENGATEPLSDAGGVNSTHYFRIYEESLDHLSVSVESASPLIEGGSLKLSFTDDGNSAVGEGIELLTNPIDREDMGKSLLFKVSADGTDDDYPEDDLIFRVVDKTNSKISFIQGNQIKKAKKGYLIDTHLADTTKDLLVSIHVADDNASDDYDIIFGTFSIGPDSVVPGLVEQYEEIDLAGSGDFTGGKIRVSKIGRQVVVSSIEAPTFSSSSNPESAAGLVPEWARPAYRKDNTYYSLTEIRTFRVYEDGKLGFFFRDFSGTNTNLTTAGDVFSVSYTVSESNSAIFSTTVLQNKSTNVTATYTNEAFANTPELPGTKLTGFTEIDDSLGEFDPTTGEFTPRESGKYTFKVPYIVGANSSGFRALIVTNETDSVIHYLDTSLSSASVSLIKSPARDLDLIAGKKYAFYLFQNSGGPLSVEVDISITRHFEPTKFAQYGQGAVGDIKQSMLTEAQFTSLHGPEWVLMDGRSVAGSRYAQITGNTTVPDARGATLRMKNNGRSDGNQDPDGERALGSYQGDALQGHFHTQRVGAGGTGSPNTNETSNSYAKGSAGSGAYNLRTTVGDTDNNLTIKSPISDGVNGTPRTSSETRMKNIAVNFFIKIN